MDALNRILIATDLSEPSLVAAQRGLNLAQQQGLECTIVHVLPRDLISDIQHTLSRWDDTFERNAIERQTRELNQRIRTLLEGRPLNVHTRLRTGQPAQEISEQTRESQAELLVMSSHGKGMIRNMLVGSTVIGVLQHTTCPVLVVRAARQSAYQTVLLAIDFSENSRAVIEAALKFAPKAHYILAHSLQARFDEMQRLAILDQDQIQAFAQDASEQALDALEQLAQSAGLPEDRYTTLVLEHQTPRDWIGTASEVQADLIVTGKHGRHVTRDRILGSFTQAVISHADRDVLVVPPTKTS